MVLAFSDPDDAMPGSAKPATAELDSQRKKYKAALDVATATLKPYALATLIGKPVLAPEVQKSIEAALDKADNTTLIASLFGAMVKMGPMLGMKEAPKPDALVKVGNVTGYKIDGDKATAQNGAETMDFIRINGRWYIEPPASARWRQVLRSKAARRRPRRGPPRRARSQKSWSAVSRS